MNVKLDYGNNDLFKKRKRFIFLQAEDGIRDVVRARGLGDVYKRQGERRHRGVFRLRVGLRRRKWIDRGRRNERLY